MSAILSNRRVILLVVVVAVLSLVLSLVITRPKQKEESPMATEIFGVKIEKNPPESRLVELGVRTWRTLGSSNVVDDALVNKALDVSNRKLEDAAELLLKAAIARWEGSPSKFPWEFKATETMYLLEGKVKVNVDGYDGWFEIGAGDLVVFPKEMKVTWDITEAVKKHYSLEK